MARSRRPNSEAEFLKRLTAAGVMPEVAKFVWREVQLYYFVPLRPDPNDRWESTMRIDAGDLEDITERFWKNQGWRLPNGQDSVQIPKDPTLLEYALWLEEQRNIQ